MWDVPGGGMTMLSSFWRAATNVDPATEGEQARVGVHEGEIAELLHPRRARGRRGRARSTTGAHYEDFDDFWEPFTFAVGPGGHLPAQAAADQQDAIRDAAASRCSASRPARSTSTARAWYARGTVPG